VPDADRQKYRQTDKQTDDLLRLRQRIGEHTNKLKTARGRGVPILLDSNSLDQAFAMAYSTYQSAKTARVMFSVTLTRAMQIIRLAVSQCQ